MRGLLEAVSTHRQRGRAAARAAPTTTRPPRLWPRTSARASAKPRAAVGVASVFRDVASSGVVATSDYFDGLTFCVMSESIARPAGSSSRPRPGARAAPRGRRGRAPARG